MKSFITPKEVELAKTDSLHIPAVLRVGTKKNAKWRAEGKKLRGKRIERLRQAGVVNKESTIKPILGIPTETDKILDPVTNETQPRPLGPPSKPKVSKEVDKYGFGTLTKVSKAAALYARKEGASFNEIKDIIGSPQRNLLKTVEALPDFEVIKKIKKVKGGKEIVRYYIKEIKAKKA